MHTFGLQAEPVYASTTENLRITVRMEGRIEDGKHPRPAALARISDAMSDRAARSEPSDRLRKLTVVYFRR